MNLRYKKYFIWIDLLICFFIVYGCVSELMDETPIALVNGEPVAYGDFKRELKGFHLRSEEKEETGPMNIKGFLDKLIRKRLFIQEGKRTGLHKHRDVKLALDSELKRQAVLILHREEIENNTQVSDEAAWEEYCSLLNSRLNDFEKKTEGLSLDPNNRSKEAKNFITRLRQRSRLEVDPNFVWHKEGPCDPNQDVARVNGKGITYNDLSVAIDESGGEKDWQLALQWLMDQELIEQERKRFSPTRESFKTVKKRLKKSLLKEELKKREDAFLREIRAKARISKETIDPNSFLTEIKDPNLPVAWINNEHITLANLRSNLRSEDLKDSTPEQVKDMINKKLQYMIDCRIIDQEALRRGYGEDPEVKKAVKEVEDRIIFNKFIRERLIPSIKINDSEVESYYEEHRDLFRTPIYVKIEEIRLNTKEEADLIRTELETGADFAFLSQKSISQRITSRHWISLQDFPPSVVENLMQTEEGEWFGPVSSEDDYSIFLLKRRKGGERIPFDRAKKSAHERLFREHYNQAIKKWEDILRSSSEVVIYEDRLNTILSIAAGQDDDNSN